MFAKNWFNAVPLSVRRVFTALLVLLLAFPAQSARADAGTAVLVADIRSGPAPSSPSYMTVFNGALYFRANDGTNGAELMKYDGSSVSLVADINPGSGGSNPAYLTVYNNALYFQADDGTNGAELWKYTGSGASTLVKNIYPGTKPVFLGGGGYSSEPSYLTVYNGELYFQANDGVAAGYELWKYNSTTDTASLVADISSSGDSSPSYLAVYKGALYFSADGRANGNYAGRELWKYDGSSASLVADINPIAGQESVPQYLTVYNGALYFNAKDVDAGQELWKFDGSSATLVKDIYSGNNSSSPSYLAVYNGALYFGATDGPTYGIELWKYNSESDTAVRVSDINSGGNSGIGYLAAYNGTLYFQAYDSGSNYELWKYSYTAPAVTTTSLQTSYSGTGPSSFTVTFDEEVYNPAGDTGAEDVTNPANFLLIEKGPNKTVDTVSCAGGVVSDDTQVTVASVTYANPTATVTFSAPLPDGDYQLFVCATTSIVDLFGNPINGGVDLTYNLTVAAASASVSASASGNSKTLPFTGFAPNRVTTLPAQPAGLAYTKMSGLWLEIPSQKVQTEIVGVPQVNSNWDVSWLGKDAGWLNGTAFPTWEGNSVLTAHVTDANGLPGPFANLKNLAYGNKIVVHLYGEKYTFEVRQSRMVFPDTTAYAFEHLKDHSYLTLITCQGYNFLTDSYMFRRVVRAVLVSVEAE
jgi:LPXTG-site transpeptidase (sortase) family protein